MYKNNIDFIYPENIPMVYIVPNTRMFQQTKKQKITEFIDKLISHSPANQIMKERIVRGLLGEYTEEEIQQNEKEAQEMIEIIEQEYENKQVEAPQPSQVFYNMTANEVISQLSIQDDPANNV